MHSVDQSSRKNGIPILKIVDLELIADAEIASFLKSKVQHSIEIDIEQFAEEHLRIRLDYGELSNNQTILGMMVFQDCHVPFYDSSRNIIKHHLVKGGTALIDKSLIDTPHSHRRARFTIAHECAHWILHRPSKHSQNKQISQNGDSNTNSKEYGIICRTSTPQQLSDSQKRTASEWMEWQADNLASALLMPTLHVRSFICEYLDNENRKASALISDFGERMIIAKTIRLIRQMATVFNVSEQAAEIRLKRLGFLTDYNLDSYQPITDNQLEVFDDWF